MNISLAKTIPIREVLDRMGLRPESEKGQQCWYLSPLRAEKTPSLHVHCGRNVWYDFGESRGGNVIDFVCTYLQSQGVPNSASDALRWLERVPANAAISERPDIIKAHEEPRLALKKATPIQHRALLQYLDTRGIALPVARKHLRQVHVQDVETRRPFFALGFRNDDGGYELRNPYFKGCIAPKTVSFIRGLVPKPDSIHVFEGMMDFLSVLSREPKQALRDDAVVLNSLSCLSQAQSYIKNYGYRMLFSWMDNDAAGRKATQALEEFAQSEEGLTHLPMNRIYAPHKDVNEWHVQTSSASSALTP